ncbi:MAG: class I SAM-dependent methyltransferase [Planctomycetota bacterium]|nr:class I SAM-dependent methyltransferase [Planctomycetota bacterium]
MTTTPSIAEQVAQYRWYHRIDLGDGVFTEPPPLIMESIASIWDFIRAELDQQDLKDARVLDIGCRDALWSLYAEQHGAKEVIGIDNGLSTAARDVVLPHLKSQVQMHEMNVNDLTPETFGPFDVVLFLGVLYHLRYPFWSLQRIVDVMEPGGRLMIESGMLATEAWEDETLLFCPTDESPYEFTSCTFFNRKGLVTTLESMGLECLHAASMEWSQTTPAPSGARVERQFLVFRKVAEGPPIDAVNTYWRGVHGALDIHSCVRKAMEERKSDS